MSILQITNGYFKRELYRHLFNSLKEVGIDNTIFVPLEVDDIQNEPEIVVSNCYTKFDRLTFIGKQKKIIRSMEKEIDFNTVDLIHAHTLFSTGYVAYILNKKLGKKYIVAVRNTDVNLFLKKFFFMRYLGLKILKNAYKVVFISPKYKEEVISNYVPSEYRFLINNKSVVIPNGISHLFFTNSDIKCHRKLENNSVIRLLFVGEINKNKNIEQLIDALTKLNKKGFRYSLQIVGQIQDNKYTFLLNDNENISYKERCPQSEVINYMNQSDIFIMTSHTETFGLVYAEALSQGLPIIYTKGQGFDGYFKDGYVGYAASDKSVDDLVEKIEMLVENYNEITQHCRLASQRFSWDLIALEYKKIYYAKDLTN